MKNVLLISVLSLQFFTATAFAGRPDRPSEKIKNSMDKYCKNKSQGESCGKKRYLMMGTCQLNDQKSDLVCMPDMTISPDKIKSFKKAGL